MARCWPWAAHAKCSRTPASSRPTWAAPTRPATLQARSAPRRQGAPPGPRPRGQRLSRPAPPPAGQPRRKDDRMSAARPPEGAHTAAEGAGVPSFAARPPEGAHTVAEGAGVPSFAARPPEGAHTAAEGAGTPVRPDARTADDQAPMLSLQKVESADAALKALRGISLQVRRGQIATVLGSNGAGKTSILKTISGIMAPLRGSIGFQGSDITARDPAAIVRRGLVHVPEGREVF